MRRLILCLVLVLTITVLLFNPWPAAACGDKLLVLGRGVRFQVDTADYAASILFYVNPNSPGSEKVEFTEFGNIMRLAGHHFKVATGREELADALKTGRFDIVLADFADAQGLEDMIQASRSKPMLLPWVYQQTKADAPRAKAAVAHAKQRYHFALMAPFKPGSFLSIIDQTMELKSKQAEARARVATTKTSFSR